MAFGRLAAVRWGLLARATLLYSVFSAGGVLAVVYGFSTVSAVDFGLLALLSIFAGIAVLAVASHGGPRSSSSALSVEGGIGSTSDRSGIVAAPIGDATLKMVFFAVGLIAWGAVGLVIAG